MRIYSVEHVIVFRKSTSPLQLVVAAFGTAATTGWTNPHLDAGADPAPADAVFEFGFEADRPGNITLPVLTPISMSIEFAPQGEADAVIVRARTNSVTVHASEFIDRDGSKPTITTMAVGEETIPTHLAAETMFPTTLRFGEEQRPTALFGERYPTFLNGEHGPWTDPRVDDPFPPMTMPTGPFGEAGPLRPGWPGDPWGGGGNPFGGF